MRKRIKRSVQGAAFAVMLPAAMLAAGCTAQTGMLDENGLRPYLSVDLQIPGHLALDEAGAFTIDVALQGAAVTADAVAFIFWSEDAPEEQSKIAAVSSEPGRYSASYQLPAEGVYVVRALVQADGLEAMPAKRFAVGADAVHELAALEAALSGEAPAETGGGHHH